MKYLLLIFTATLLNACTGHGDYINFENSLIGKKTTDIKPFKFKDAGEFHVADFVIVGQGITHVSKDENGNLITHWDSAEVLPIYHKKAWVGKCLTYNVVDPKTNIIKSWGFDKGGNPLSCRSW